MQYIIYILGVGQFLHYMTYGIKFSLVGGKQILGLLVFLYLICADLGGRPSLVGKVRPSKELGY